MYTPCTHIHTRHSSYNASPFGRQLQHTIFFWRAQLSQKYTHTNWYTKFGSSSEKGWLLQCCCWITNPRWQKSTNLTLQANNQEYACTEYVCKLRPFYDINSLRAMHNSPVNIISGCTYINIHSDNGPAYILWPSPYRMVTTSTTCLWELKIKVVGEARLKLY